MRVYLEVGLSTPCLIDRQFGRLHKMQAAFLLYKLLSIKEEEAVPLGEGLI